ncbi:hypothetical protein FJTKL_06984 [Diaporthe vaccinii]|uniref:FAD-binding domain-containing protein n=1 Tax=Diaporthe vaccinii TaxID=105482 RepID=A0ABR4DQR4_9PEZI
MSFALNAFGSLLGLVSRCLTTFLGAMGYYSRRPTKPDLPFGSLSFVIVGAGIAGLTAALALKKKGHHVIVVEKSKFATEQGAALTLSPNCSVLLNWLDLLPESCGSDLVHHMIRHDRDGNLLLHADLSNRRKGWIAEWYYVQRHAFHNFLKEKALQEEIVLHTSCKISKIDVDEARVTLEDGRRFHGDVLLGADGIHSITRAEVSPGAKPKTAGFSAFRWLMPIEKVAAIMADKGPVHVVQNPGCMLQWDDTDRRLLAYPCSNNTIYNMLAYVPSSAVGVIEEGTWNSDGSKDNLIQAFSKFSPEAQQLVAEADDSLRVFALSDLDPLPSWVRGRTTLLGDAAHIVQPYVGQGASMAVEDALSLAVMFPLGTRPEDVNMRLRLYEKARMSRTKMVYDWSLKNRPGSVPLTSEGSWWFSNAVTKLNSWRVLALTAMFMQQTFGHNEIDHSEKLLQQSLARRPSFDVDAGRRRSSIWSFVLGDGQMGTTSSQ